MNQQELETALTPVREYFKSQKVNTNTVLAAYLRSYGLPSKGEPWEIAKQAMKNGASFQQAALTAASALGRDGETSRSPSVQELASSRRTKKPDATDSNSMSPSRITRSESSPHHEEQTHIDAKRITTTMQWFPKRFGPGDLAGEGAKALLGKPDLEQHVVLVRETAQNCWDARGDAEAIEFTLNLRMLDKQAITILQDKVFAAAMPPPGLHELLDRDSVWALEISDRGTTGLTGPTTNDRASDSEKSTNYIDLVLNVGATRNKPLGGGTYGFGKTISYIVSHVGTILIWSRCNDGKSTEDRLIGSAISDAFDMGGYRYTGRHWWGDVNTEDGRVEPLLNENARALGEAMFAKGFSTAETGTSILILDPNLSGMTPEEYVETLKDAVVEHLWPKLMQEQADRTTMSIDIQLNGESKEIPDVENHETIRGYVDCLRAVRAVQVTGPDDVEARLSTLDFGFITPVVKTIWHRKRTIVGHLALVRFPVPRGLMQDKQAHSVCLMRNEAELVVKYVDFERLDLDGFQWAGVFKPVAQVDEAFAAAEPPAHDDWVPRTIENRTQKEQVNVSLREIRGHARQFTSSPDGARPAVDPTVSTAIIGDALADLVHGTPGSHPGPRPKPHEGDKPTIRPKVVITDTESHPADEAGWIRASVTLRIDDPEEPAHLVDVTVTIGTDGGSDQTSIADLVNIIGWEDAGSETWTKEPVEIERNLSRQFVFEFRSDVAVDVNAEIVTD